MPTPDLQKVVLEKEAVKQGCASNLEIAQHLVGARVHVTL
jgi:hypothetical protein